VFLQNIDLILCDISFLVLNTVNTLDIDVAVDNVQAVEPALVGGVDVAVVAGLADFVVPGWKSADVELEALKADVVVPVWEIADVALAVLMAGVVVVVHKLNLLLVADLDGRDPY
jgi:hypothetical protein